MGMSYKQKFDLSKGVSPMFSVLKRRIKSSQ